MKQFKSIIQRRESAIKHINEQRQLWLIASSIVFTAVVSLIFSWDWLSGLHEKSVWWVIVSIMLMICMNWWYWTMKVIRLLLQHQQEEYELIRDLLLEIKNIREELKDLNN